MTRLSQDFNARALRFRRKTIAAFSLTAALIAGVAAGAVDEPAELPTAGDQAAPAPTTLPDETDGDALQLPRLREGTQLTDRLGRFRQEGESLTFIDEDGREIGGLPNLNLERIIRMLKSAEEPDSVWWSVSGVVTEFSGRNFLLVTRAVYKTAALPPTPETVE
jgi:hypothetical protein